MPSPIGHALGGAIVALALGRRSPDRTGNGPGVTDRAVVTLAVTAAVVPDLDFLWGRHNMETHSLGAAVLAGLAVYLWTRGRSPRVALIVALAWVSHVVFDWLGSDTTPPLGVMALWPISSRFYFADAFIFEAITRRTWLPNFWTHNLWAVTEEVLMLAPILALAAWWRREVRRPSGGA